MMMQNLGVDLKHLESRPAPSDPSKFDFFATMKVSGEQLPSVVEALGKVVTVRVR